MWVVVDLDKIKRWLHVRCVPNLRSVLKCQWVIIPHLGAPCCNERFSNGNFHFDNLVLRQNIESGAQPERCPDKGSQKCRRNGDGRAVKRCSLSVLPQIHKMLSATDIISHGDSDLPLYNAKGPQLCSQTFSREIAECIKRYITSTRDHLVYLRSVYITFEPVDNYGQQILQ